MTGRGWGRRVRLALCKYTRRPRLTTSRSHRAGRSAVPRPAVAARAAATGRGGGAVAEARCRSPAVRGPICSVAARSHTRGGRSSSGPGQTRRPTPRRWRSALLLRLRQRRRLPPRRPRPAPPRQPALAAPARAQASAAAAARKRTRVSPRGRRRRPQHPSTSAPRAAPSIAPSPRCQSARARPVWGCGGERTRGSVLGSLARSACAGRALRPDWASRPSFLGIRPPYLARSSASCCCSTLGGGGAAAGCAGGAAQAAPAAACAGGERAHDASVSGEVGGRGTDAGRACASAGWPCAAAANIAGGPRVGVGEAACSQPGLRQRARSGAAVVRELGADHQKFDCDNGGRETGTFRARTLVASVPRRPPRSTG